MNMRILTTVGNKKSPAKNRALESQFRTDQCITNSNGRRI